MIIENNTRIFEYAENPDFNVKADTLADSNRKVILSQKNTSDRGWTDERILIPNKNVAINVCNYLIEAFSIECELV